MRTNLFEGFRRISLLLKLVIASGALFLVGFASPPSLYLRFETASPIDSWVPSTYDCKIGTDAIEFSRASFAPDRTADVALCFKAQTFKDRLLVPFRSDDSGMLWGNEPYSQEVLSYTERRVREFALSQTDKASANSEWTSKRNTAIRNGFATAVGAWIGLSVLQILIGWIVRGFLGIPMGSDHRPQDPPTEAAG